jgi:hypothetical protein
MEPRKLDKFHHHSRNGYWNRKRVNNLLINLVIHRKINVYSDSYQQNIVPPTSTEEINKEKEQLETIRQETLDFVVNIRREKFARKISIELQRNKLGEEFIQIVQVSHLQKIIWVWSLDRIILIKMQIVFFLLLNTKNQNYSFPE